MTLEWKRADVPVAYPEAESFMRARVVALKQARHSESDAFAPDAQECIWLLEHPPLYTAGSSAKGTDLLRADFPVYATGRGGQYTYHGLGQRIAYTMLDLKARAAARGEAPDLRKFVQQLEQWLIDTLAHFKIQGFLREGRIGVWVETPVGEAKIAALGVRCEQWVTSHGVALNVAPDLSHYAGIVPCGIRGFGVTSMAAVGVHVTMEEVDTVMQQCSRSSASLYYLQ
jgi:lipoyl(octanoyl) transferase